MKVRDRIRAFFGFKPKKQEQTQPELLQTIGAITLLEFHGSRKLRRKIKGTRLEHRIIQALKDDNK